MRCASLWQDCSASRNGLGPTVVLVRVVVGVRVRPCRSMAMGSTKPVSVRDCAVGRAGVVPGASNGVGAGDGELLEALSASSICGGARPRWGRGYGRDGLLCALTGRRRATCAACGAGDSGVASHSARCSPPNLLIRGLDSPDDSKLLPLNWSGTYANKSTRTQTSSNYAWRCGLVCHIGNIRVLAGCARLVWAEFGSGKGCATSNGLTACSMPKGTLRVMCPALFSSAEMWWYGYDQVKTEVCDQGAVCRFARSKELRVEKSGCCASRGRGDGRFPERPRRC